MPELPEVETVRRGLALAMTGATFRHVAQHRPNLRFPFPSDFVERLTGRRIQDVGRRAKYLTIDLDDGLVLAAHLGMTGSFRVVAPGRAEGDGALTPGAYYHARSTAAPHDHVRFELDNGVTITYNDPRRFGFMTLVARQDFASHALFRDIGVEPLDSDFNAEVLARLLRDKTTPLKAALLDQRLVAGLGNIYVCEALHRAGLSPCRIAGTLVRPDGRPTVKASRLAKMIRIVLEEAVEAGGSSLRDYRHTDGTLGTFQHGFRAYDREGHPCTASQCRGTITRIVQSGRSTFLCAACQK
jgi:formamidopyrimidine-DNA glycosylase